MLMDGAMNHHNQTPKPPFDVEKQQLYSELPPDVWAPYPISKAEPSSLTQEKHFSSLHLQSHNFDRHSKLRTIGKGWNVDQMVNWKLYLPAQFPLHHSGPTWCLHYCWYCNSPPVKLTLHFPLLWTPPPFEGASHFQPGRSNPPFQVWGLY